MISELKELLAEIGSVIGLATVMLLVAIIVILAMSNVVVWP